MNSRVIGHQMTELKPQDFLGFWTMIQGHLKKLEQWRRLNWTISENSRSWFDLVPVIWHFIRFQYIILHSGATQSLYDSAETGFLAPYLSAFCHLFGGDWYAGRIMVLLVNLANHLSCPTCIEQQEIRQVIWLNFAFRIGRYWNLAIMFVCLHSLLIFIQCALEVTWYFRYSFLSWRHQLIKTQVFGSDIYRVDTHSGIYTFLRSNFSSSAQPCEHGYYMQLLFPVSNQGLFSIMNIPRVISLVWS